MASAPCTGASLDTWLQYIEKLHTSNIELGLDRLKAVYKALGDLHIARKVVVVAGTNGKGSTVAMMDHLFREARLKTGTYTSPHLHQFNERVRIGGVNASDQQLVSAFEDVEDAREKIPLTYFEFTTLAALLVLSRAELDVAILEIGLGGRLDAVNIVDADLCLITSIGLDHEDWLGGSVEQIGREKAGIMRANVPCLLGEGMPESVGEVAAEVGAPVLQFGRDFDIQSGAAQLHNFEVTWSKPECALPESNQALALQASALVIEGLGLPIQDIDLLARSLDGFNIPGRIEHKMLNGCQLILDVGHNPQAAIFLAEYLNKIKPADISIVAVYSALEDKDVDGVVSPLAPFVDTWYVGQLAVPRALPAEKMVEKIGAYSENVLSFLTIPQALETAIEQANTDNTWVLCFGSFFVVEAVSNYLHTL